MSGSILRVCRGCARYTLEEHCPACRAATRTPHPARYSPQDRYGRYRRMLLEAARGEPA